MKTPNKGTKKYRAVVEAGCGGQHDIWGEFDCQHAYGWTCDYCPCSLEARKYAEEAVVEMLIWPPKEIDL